MQPMVTQIQEQALHKTNTESSCLNKSNGASTARWLFNATKDIPGSGFVIREDVMASYLLELCLAQMMVLGLSIGRIVSVTEDIMSRKLSTLQP